MGKSDTAAPTPLCCLLTQRRNRPHRHRKSALQKLLKSKTKIQNQGQPSAICTMCHVRTFYIEAPHCNPSQCHSRVKLLENIDEYYARMRMTCSSSSPSTSTSGTSGTSSSSCSSGMKRSCEDRSRISGETSKRGKTWP